MIAMRNARSLPLTLLLLAAAFSASADDAEFAGQWMITIEAPGIVPYEGLLEIERTGGQWLAWVENGPAPVRTLPLLSRAANRRRCNKSLSLRAA